MPGESGMFEASDQQPAFRESIDDLIAQINQLEATLGIPAEGKESSLGHFDDIYKRKDGTVLPAASYLGMARVALDFAAFINSKSNIHTRHILKTLCLANQCVATVRALTDRYSVDDQMCDAWAKLRHAEVVQNGKKGIEIRHAPMRQLRAWAIEKYRGGNWTSANEAACALSEAILDHGRTINAVLKPSNAQRTIAEWFRKSV